LFGSSNLDRMVVDVLNAAGNPNSILTEF